MATSKTDSHSSRLGIRHLLLLTCCTAMALTVDRWLVDDEITLISRATRVTYCFVYGFALTGLCLFVWRRMRGASAIKHPGHALLVLAGFGAVIDGGVEVGIEIWFWSWSLEDLEFVQGYFIWYVRWVWHQAVGYALITAISLWVFRIAEAPWRWQASFAAILLTFVVQCLTYGLAIGAIYDWGPRFAFTDDLPQWCMLVCSLICTAIILTSAAIDHSLKTRRDWLHWCGLAVSALLAGMEWIRFWRSAITDYFA